MVANMVRIDTPLGIRERINGDSNALWWSVVGLALYQVGSAIGRVYQRQEWKEDEKIALVFALRKCS